jgi:NAD-dependent SIR2 family protein deacetylase
VELQWLGKLRFLITQNTDNLHRRSGIRPELLAELHGNGWLVRCMSCDRLYTRQEVGWDTKRWGPGYRTQKPMLGQPACAACGGRLVSSVVNFGDPLPQKRVRAGRRARPPLRPGARPRVVAPSGARSLAGVVGAQVRDPNSPD